MEQCRRCLEPVDPDADGSVIYETDQDGTAGHEDSPNPVRGGLRQVFHSECDPGPHFGYTRVR